MATSNYLDPAHSITSPHQFGGYTAVENSSMDPSAANANAANATRSATTTQTLATVDQAARKSSM